MNDILILIVLTLLPLLELRASIPYGILNTDLSLMTVFLIAVMANILLAPLLWVFLHGVIDIFLKNDFINRLYQNMIVRTQHKVHKYVDRYGLWGLALFIGVPLPGSGVYSGALGAYLLGFKFKDFLIASIIGVLIAGVIVLLVTAAGDSAWNIFVKNI